MEDHADLEDALGSIDPATLSYEEWVEVGMGLHDSGLAVGVWDAWSRRDPARYREGECARKWAGFGSSGRPVRSGTIAKMARDRGWVPEREGRGRALAWDGTIEGPMLDPSWVEPAEIDEGGEWDPARELSDYIAALFDEDEFVGYVCDSWERDGRWTPKSRGCYTRTAGDVLRDLKRYGDVARALGEYDRRAGAWIRFNPLSGAGVRNADVTDFRFALVESDTLPKDRQLAVVRQLQLPCAAIVDSGNKSVHAIVRVDAKDFSEYRERVDALYDVCRKSGLEPDAQNKNPSRLSRMPGVERGGQRQRLLSLSCGKASWAEWWEWLQDESDDLPEDTNSDWDEPIELAPPLIGTEGDGVLRCGQKMVLAGPSKAGKSFCLIDLAEAIACGGRWLGWPCLEGPVYYVNLEIADSSFRQRQHVVWADRELHQDVGSGVESVKENFVRLDLRGHAQEMGRLAPIIVRRVLKRAPRGGFRAVIVDPIYKVNGGDENDARAISQFTNSLDLLAAQLGCAVIYAHHHAKGQMGQRKAMDRMSGSGVFARDADAILDLTQIEVPEEARGRLGEATAWRMTATLREFRSPEPIDLLFRFPRFYRDATGELAKFEVEGGSDPFSAVNRAKQEKAKRARRERNDAIEAAVSACELDGVPATKVNVLERIGEVGGASVSASMLGDWAKPAKDMTDWRMSYRGRDFVFTRQDEVQ